MSEHVLSQERAIDEGISTATLAGLDGGTIRTDEEEVVRTERNRHDDDTGPLPADLNTERADLNGERRNAADHQAIKLPAATPAVEKSSTAEEQTTPLFPSGEATDLHSRWDAIQVGFVDEPRRAVEQADALVAGAMKRMAEIFAEERARLEGQWDRGDSVSTEDLRLALRRYRSFFGRVLSV